MRKFRGVGYAHSALLAVGVGLTLGSFQAMAMDDPQGAVFTLSNDAAGNSVVVFQRRANGTLETGQVIATGGLGTGQGLGSQGALTLANRGEYLLAVNPGSNDISVFRVHGTELEVKSKADSGGIQPISLTAHGALVYVLNAGAPANISGFWLRRNHLDPIPNSTRRLSTENPGPAEVHFSPQGDELVVTEKATNNVLTFRVGLDGRVGNAEVHPSNGQTPFGFDFTPEGILIVSEAVGGATNLSTVSSYLTFSVPWFSFFQTLSASVPDFQSAACWVVTTNDGHFAFASNTGSGSISGYAVQDGRISLITPNGQTALTGDGSKPADMAIARNHLYVLNGGTHEVASFDIAPDGSLVPTGKQEHLPNAAAGLVAY